MTPYRLTLDPPLEAFRPEVEHALQFVDDCYGLVRTSDAATTLHYGATATAGSVHIRPVLLPDGIRIAGDGIHPRLDAIACLCPPGKGLLPDGNDLDYDAIGLIFLLLSRLEERVHPALDRYERFPITAALLQPEAGRLYPWADRAAHDIAAALTGTRSPAPQTRYQVKFTHDVDRLKGYHRPFDPLRASAGDILRRGAGLAQSLARLKTAYLGGEPFWCARRMMDLSERHGIVSHFYFMGPSKHPMDSPYVLSMRSTLRRLIGEIKARGHVCGYHPGFMTARNPAEWQRQRCGLEEAAGIEVREGRQHVLRYDAAVTPRIWSDAGMELDCTPAYPEVVGFRTGTCRPARAFDLVARTTLPLRQISTPVMEFGLFGGKYRDLDDDTAAADANWARDLCRTYGGTYTLLFHTSLREPRLWNWFDRVLRDAVQPG